MTTEATIDIERYILNHTVSDTVITNGNIKFFVGEFWFEAVPTTDEEGNPYLLFRAIKE